MGSALLLLVGAVVLVPLSRSSTSAVLGSSSRPQLSTPLQQPPRFSIYYALGNPAWSPTPYDVGQYGIIADATLTFDVSSGAQSPWPALKSFDRGEDGRPCAGPSSEPCYNFSYSAVDCAKANGVRRETPWATTEGLPPVLCCSPGGCIPQEGNVSAISTQVAGVVKDRVLANFTDNAVLDVEGWNPIVTPDIFGSCNTKETGRNTTTASFFAEQGLRNYSLASVLHMHPGIAPREAMEVAQREFSNSAATILTAALEAAKAVRPLAQWGYFGEVGLCNLDGPCADPGTSDSNGGTDPLCGYDHPTAGAALRAQAEAQRQLWLASDRLFPSIYFESTQPSGVVASYACDAEHFSGPACRNVSLDGQRALQHSTIAQAVHASASSASHPSVFPFMWQCASIVFGNARCLCSLSDFASNVRCPDCDRMFPCNKNATFHLTRWGLRESLMLPYLMGADGVVIWVDMEEANRLAEVQALVETQTGPLARDLLQTIDTCAGRQCNGHGRCQTLPSLPPLPPPPPPWRYCLKSCAATPCGRCTTGCPTNSSVCKLPSGRISSRNQCLCNEQHLHCRGNLTLCPPPSPLVPLVPPVPPLQPVAVRCICDVGFAGAHCEQHDPLLVPHVGADRRE